MIAHRITSHNPIEIDPEETIQAVLALLNQRQAVSMSRWVCEVCGMVHMGQMPRQCDSCGSSALVQQSEIHREMNNHW
jgi:rubrerythrin